ncbi:MAG TPA: MFS transporter [Ramlibacter sp.]|jgi:MFS family permease|nr:MFS transporter [Ramlibacter sp.]
MTAPSASLPVLDRNWPLVAAGALMTCVAIGVVFSLAVFLDPMGADTGWSRAGISLAMTLAFLSMGLSGFGWGALSDRIGPRRVVLVGVLLLGLASILASQAGSLLQFQVTFGVLIGVAAGAFFAPIISATTVSFEKRRGLAVSLVSAGMGIAPMTIAPLAGWLVTLHGWRATMLGIGLATWVLLLPAVRWIRVVPLPATGPGVVPVGAPGSGAKDALRSTAFLVLAGAFFACCAAHSGPIFHTVSYAIGCGLPMVAAVTIYSMEGVGGLGGRLLFGVAADKYGAKPVLVVGLLVQAVAAVSYLAVNQLGGFYVVALIFGAAYGGTMPLYAALAREAFDARIQGTVLGAATLLSSLGMALGPFIGGWLYDRFGSYAWLYIGSAIVGLAAAGIAMLFPRRHVPSRGAALVAT